MPRPLRTWLAWSYSDAPLQGQTKPLFYRCISREAWVNGDESELATFLVKALKSDIPMTREVVGNRIAELAGLTTPEPAKVLLPKRTAESVDAARREAGVFSSQQPGWVSGARQFNALNVMTLADVPRILLDQALRLYTFDMLALHADRKERNPNCAMTAEGLMVYDFEQCFSEEPRFVPEDCPHWRVATVALGREHMFYTGLCGAKNVRQTARRVVSAMTDRRLEGCLEGLPRTWVPEGERIVAHVKNVRNHADEFVDDIVRSLSP
jgi:hypothetical protein